MLPRTGTKLTKKCGSEFDAVVAPSDATEKKPQYRCTTTIHPVYNCSKEILENLLPVGLLVRTNLFIPSGFWSTHTKFDSCCQRYVATCRKILYRCTSTVLALNYCSRIFFKSFSYLYEVVRTNFSANFWTFRD